MSDDSNNLIDFTTERGKRIHDLKERRLQEVRSAFEQALPLAAAKKKKRKPKKK
ncbi:hypothetical protein [uncultured Pseudomonas sp.]|uniref:hypothetical protein n=1 Tax=uncultured Pseudomonas sp. TaxID=114707 RepID=UPI0025DF3EAE|nr:hypothetical protein [uncultured Pseudomonas sp.]